VTPKRTPKPPKPKPKRYVKQHNKVYNTKGSATTRKCVGCGGPAVDWSQRHGTSGAQPSHYQPRCRTCHRRYDVKKRTK